MLGQPRGTGAWADESIETPIPLGPQWSPFFHRGVGWSPFWKQSVTYNQKWQVWEFCHGQLCTERRGEAKVIFAGFTAGVSDEGSGFCDLPWGRGVLISVACLGKMKGQETEIRIRDKLLPSSSLVNRAIISKPRHLYNTNRLVFGTGLIECGHMEAW